ncbi:sugar transferase [Bacteroides sp. 51]|uniref:sugar transferase n=1 Tax=Bacteroides sp. 51 TaxID=2302938 RepID=UPI0013D010C0|nr:sugar transferase [Bacteroides sp. 51]NDV82027.1 sugar transferase [Bacteroides sp. 51]
MTFKYIFDKLFSFLGLIILFPLLLLIYFLILIKMPKGPVFFKQKRIGKHGNIFTMYKFRSMLVSHSGSSVSVKGESRITPFGAFLRKYKLDELPELWNVLKGDMSIVGPRPDVPGYADRLEGSDRRMLLLKPGITGPASLKYRNEEELLAEQNDPQRYNDEVLFPDKVRINIAYLDNWSFWYDIKIIIYTVLGRDL